MQGSVFDYSIESSVTNILLYSQNLMEEIEPVEAEKMSLEIGQSKKNTLEYLDCQGSDALIRSKPPLQV